MPLAPLIHHTSDFTESLTLSVKGNRWQLADADERMALALRQKYDLPDIVCRILASRGHTVETAPEFLSPSIKSQLPDPLHLKDMAKAATALADAIRGQKSIAIFGDYDVDGASSSALLYRFITEAGGAEPRIYIPDRIIEGYGPSEAALKTLKGEGAELVVMVDCGTMAYGPLEAAKKMGLDVIVIDHHLSDGGVPEAIAVVNPNRVDEDTPLRNLCAAGVSFLLAVATNRMLRESGHYRLRHEPQLLNLLDLVALGTVCDVMTLTGLNRAFVSQGLKVMAQRRNIGLAALADIAKLEEAPSVYHAGFVFGPRINAGGRVGSSHIGARLLSTDDAEEAATLARQLDVHNRERQAVEKQVLEEALSIAEKMKNQQVLIIAKQGWHPGVIGIVAGRIKEAYGKPTAIVAMDNGVGKASARSIAGVDMGSAITAARMAGLLVAGGGHAMAAGFTVEEGQLSAFTEFMTSRLKSHVENALSARALKADAILPPQALTPALMEQLEALAPYGTGNPQPLFFVPYLRIIKCDIVGENHVRAVLTDGGPEGSHKARIKAVAFREAASPLGSLLLQGAGKDVHLAARPRINRWMGNISVELHIEDACAAS